MESCQTTWITVSNSVEERMLDHSLAHKLIPTSKLCRRTKAMNSVIMRCKSLKTYHQYVKLRTSVLRNISDDEETDDSSNFIDDDYDFFSRSDLAWSSYMLDRSKKDEDMDGLDSEFDIEDIELMKSSKSKSCEPTNVNSETNVENEITGDIFNHLKKKTNTSNFKCKTMLSASDDNLSLKSQSHTHPDSLKTFKKSTKSHKLYKNKSSIANSIHQLKDSGIEENTDDEVSKSDNKMEREVQGTENNVPVDSLTSMGKDYLNSVSQNSEFTEHNKLHDVDPIEKIKFLETSTRNEEGSKQSKWKQELQPKITSTEVFNKKYNIVTSHDLPYKYHRPQEFVDKEAYDVNDFESSIEQNIVPLTKKQLFKRKINLTTESNSTASEDDGEYHSTKNTESKKLKRFKKYSDLSIKEDEYDCRTINRCNIPLQEHFEIQEYKEKKHTHSIHTKSRQHNENRQNVQQKDTQSSSSEQPLIYRRPYNLQELVEAAERQGERLTTDMTLPTLLLKDIKEHEIFIMDIPTYVFERQLVGKKIVLNQSRLKLGKKKYKADYKDTNNVTCVFATGKSQEPYKIVNIKPTASVVAHRKVLIKTNTKSIYG